MSKKIVKRSFILLLFIVIVYFVVQISSATPEAVLKNLLKRGVLNNQSLNLKLNYLLVIPVGEAKLSNLGKERFRNEDLIHLKAEAKTFDYVRSIFYAKATIDSYIDPALMHTVYFLQHQEMINKPVEDKELRYDQKKHIMTYRGPRGVEERVIDEHAQDPLSAIFYIQNKKLSLGEEFAIGLNTNQKNYIISGKAKSKQAIKLYNNNYEVWVVEASVGRKDKNPRHKSRFKIWFLENNGFKIPILIKAMTNIGPIVAKAE